VFLFFFAPLFGDARFRGFWSCRGLRSRLGKALPSPQVSPPTDRRPLTRPLPRKGRFQSPSFAKPIGPFSPTQAGWGPSLFSPFSFTPSQQQRPRKFQFSSWGPFFDPLFGIARRFLVRGASIPASPFPAPLDPSSRAFSNLSLFPLSYMLLPSSRGLAP